MSAWSQDRGGHERRRPSGDRKRARPASNSRRDGEGDRRRRSDDDRRLTGRAQRGDRPRRWSERRDPRHRDRPQAERDQTPPERATAPTAPELPDEIRAEDLDRSVRAELRTLARPVAEMVARRLVAVGMLLDADPDLALSHAIAARRVASRVAVVREAVGLAAYRAGQWQTALSEIRTYQRMTGRKAHVAVLADCERGLGRPERAVDLYRATRREELAPDEASELLIVAAGARRDLGQLEAALTMLQVPELTEAPPAPWVARLRYAYADTLLAAGRRGDAREWFARAAEIDTELVTDAADRLLELDGVGLQEADLDDEPATREPDEAQKPRTAPATAPTEPLVSGYDLVLLDLDGVVYVGEEPVPGAVEAIKRLRSDGPRVMYATNNASRTPQQVAAVLTRLGVEAVAEDVVTSAMAAAAALRDRLAPGAAVLVVGAEALAEEIRRAGLQPVERADERPAAVVQGYAPDVGWRQLAEAAVAIRAGAQWVATNTDATLPTPRGPLPGNGSLVAALRTALERDPDLVVGKPQPTIFETAIRLVGAKQALVVGDRLDTDIAGARRAGLDSLLVLTGVTTQEDLANTPDPQRPTFVGADLGALFSPPVRP